MISAKAVIGLVGGSNTPQGNCTLLVNNVQVDLSYANVSQPGGILFSTAKLMGTASFLTNTNSIVVNCQTAFGSATASNPVLIAEKVGNIN